MLAPLRLGEEDWSREDASAILSMYEIVTASLVWGYSGHWLFLLCGLRTCKRNECPKRPKSEGASDLACGHCL